MRLRVSGRCSKLPLSAQLSASVAPDVNARVPPPSPIAASTCPRATAIAAAASRPAREGEWGLAK